MDHNAQGQPRFAAFIEKADGTFFESVGPMTIREFKTINLVEVQ